MIVRERPGARNIRWGSYFVVPLFLAGPLLLAGALQRALARRTLRQREEAM